MLTHQVPAELTKPAIDKLFSDVASRYLHVPGLIRKYFGRSEDGAQVTGIYLWTGKQAADAFYSPDWIANVSNRLGPFVKTELIVPVVAESAEGKIVEG